MLDPHESGNTKPDLGDQTAAKILATCRRLLKTVDFGLDDNFFESGGNSLLAMLLVVELENQFGIRVGSDAFIGRRTVRELCSALKEGVRVGPVSVLPLTPRGGTALLYFMHAAFEFNAFCDSLSPSISASFAMINDPKWLRQLMSDHDILGVLDQVTGAYADVIASTRQDGPLFVAGHSSGGIFAVETARHLEQRGSAPDYIFLFDTYLHSWLRRTIYDVLRNGLIIEKSRRVCRVSADDASVPNDGGTKSVRSSDIALSDVKSEAEFGLLLSRVREEVSAAYRGPGRALPCHTVLFQANRTAGGRLLRVSPDLGWARCLQPRFSVVQVAADHFNMIKGSNAAAIAEEINRLVGLELNDVLPH